MCYSLRDLVTNHNSSDVSLIFSTESVSFKCSIPKAWATDSTRLFPIVFECITTFVCLNASLSAINTYTDDDHELIVGVTNKL